MHLLTWHGTLVCAPGTDGVLRHSPLPLAPGDQPLVFDAENLTPPAEIAHPVLGHLIFRQAAAASCVHVCRAGFFMCATMPSGHVVFDRTEPLGWETFLPLNETALADLDYILRSGWVDGSTRAFIRRDACALEESFWLRIGLFAADLTDGPGALVAGRDPAGQPLHLRVGSDAAAQEIFAAPPGASALVALSRRPSRARRMAESLTLATFRYLGRREPVQADFDAAVQKMDKAWDAEGIEDLFLSITDPALEAEPAQRFAVPKETAPDVKPPRRQADADREAAKDAQARGDYAAAERHWSACITQNPLDAFAATKLSALLWSLGRLSDAMALLRDLLELAPDSTEVRLILASRYAEFGWLDRAGAECAKLSEAVYGWLAATRQSLQTRLADERASATRLEAARAAGALSPDDVRQLARSLFACGDIPRCQAVLAAWHASGALPGEAWLLQAELALREQGPKAALACIREAPSAAQRHAPLILLHARLRLDQGEAAEAADALKFLAAARPSHDAYLAQSRALMATGNHAALAKVTRDWMAFDPHSVAASMFGIEAARAAGRVGGLQDASAGVFDDPPVIVQYWNEAHPPEDVVATIASWQALNPYARAQLFDDGAARGFIAQNFGGRVLQAYEAAHHPAMRSDIFRLAYLQKNGGCYADADELCMQSIETLFGLLARADFVGWLSVDTPPYVHNSFFLLRKNNALMREALLEACSAVVRHTEAGRKPDIWHETGPGLLTRAVARALSDTGSGFRAALLSLDEVERFTRTQDLAYKRTKQGDWRAA